MTIGIFHSTLRDALVMERLTGSPRIVDIYGHCGLTVTAEALPYEIDKDTVPGGAISAGIDLEDLKKQKDVKPLNNFTVDEKLQMAIEMAESLADLHGFKDGVM